MYFMSLRDRSATEVNTPRVITSRSILANQISTWFSQDEYVGVKWNRPVDSSPETRRRPWFCAPRDCQARCGCRPLSHHAQRARCRVPDGSSPSLAALATPALDPALPPRYMDDEHVFVFQNAVDSDVFPDSKASQTGAQIGSFS
jgi:hypothetical protein